MFTPEYCETRAEECEALAAECDQADLSREWRRMAVEWRIAAYGEAGDAEGRPVGAGSNLRLVTVDGRPV